MQWAGMLRGCSKAGTVVGQQRIEMPGGGGLKRSRPMLECRAIEDKEEKRKII
jgi:hypothetical protein